MWKTQTIYLILKTRKFEWFLTGNNKLPLFYQVLHVSQMHYDAIAIYDVKYLCLISHKSVEKNKVESPGFKSIFESKASTTQLREATWLICRKEVTRNTFLAELSKVVIEKRNRSKLPMRFEVMSSDGIYLPFVPAFTWEHI